MMNPFPSSYRVGFVVVLTVIIVSSSTAWHTCPTGGICPDGDTCCPSTIPGQPSTCISGKNATSGSCCTDNNDSSGIVTGCGCGFHCSYSEYNNDYYCSKDDVYDYELPDFVPRYRLCSVPEKVIKEVYGLNVLSTRSTNEMNDTDTPRMAYLSTMGAVDSNDTDVIAMHAKVQTLVIVVHGSERNVDDYICCTNSALPLHDQIPQQSSIMLITPWFLAPDDPFTGFANTDATTTTTTMVEPIRWAEKGPICHTWRYGADAINANISSYGAVDAIIDTIMNEPNRFPLLKRIVVAGHSAGGQFTQRWALLSSCSAFPNTNVSSTRTQVHVRIVVANPKSYCYLDNRRVYVNDTFSPPTDFDIATCPSYNEWEWGFGVGNDLPTPYKDRAIEFAGRINEIIVRYGQRDVVYLSGEHDVLFNGECESQLQGLNRRERSENFFRSLSTIYGHNNVHKRFVVPNVHHDHCLMFQSKEGYEAFFSDDTWNFIKDEFEKKKRDVVESGR